MVVIVTVATVVVTVTSFSKNNISVMCSGQLFAILRCLYPHRLSSVSAIDSVCVSQTVYVHHGHSLSVTDSLCLSEKVCVCHRQSVSVTDSLCPSQASCVCIKHYS